MNVLFINKPFFIEPLGPMYLISALKKAGHNVEMILTTKNGALLLDKHYDLVLYSIMTGDYEMYNEVNVWIKEHFRNAITIAGGPHPTFFPEMIDLPDCSFDAICIGEGEEAIVEIANGGDINDTKNIWTRATHNQVRPLIKNLDTIEFPDREEVFKFPNINEGPIKHFIAGRGCCFQCKYCFNHAYGKIYSGQKRVRFRSVDNVIDEIDEVITMSPTKVVYFQDDTFILNKGWLREFSEKYSKRIELPYHCHCRANLVDDEVAQLLYDSNCRSVHLAAEAGNPEIRKQLLNRDMSNEMIEDAVDLLRCKYGIKVMLQNMIGLPGTTWENDLETLELNINCQPDYSWVSIFQPYPKTELGEYAQKNGYYTGDFSDIGSNFFDGTPLNFDPEHANKLQNLQKLFAWIVQYPKIYHTKMFDVLVSTKDEALKRIFTELYKKTRKLSDEILYGVKLG